jgi:hypothetical protein
VLAEVSRLADRFDGGASVPEPALDLEAAAAAVVALRPRGGPIARSIAKAEESIQRAAQGEIAARSSTFGSVSALLLVPRAHVAGLARVVDLHEQHEKVRLAIQVDETLSDVGRGRKLSALQEQTSKALDAVIAETEALVDRHVEARRQALQKQFATPPPPAPTVEERLLREIRVGTFLQAHAGLPLEAFRALVGDLVGSGSVLAATALRALVVRFAVHPDDLRGFVAQLQTAERGVAVERMIARPETLAAACEWVTLSRVAHRMRAEWAALRKNTGAADIFLDGWEKDRSAATPGRGA